MKSPGDVTFVVHRALGGGGMADVFLATMKAGGEETKVALKRMRPTLVADPSYRVHFEREARIGASLRHPNVVALHRFGEDAQGPWLALELVDGVPAARLMAARPGHSGVLPLAVALGVLADVVEGLDCAHRQGIVHRDLSPDNVLVGFDGVAKLSDFGIARAEEATRLTTTGTVRGKVAYLAPELFDGAPSSSATDRYALGVLAFVLLGGVPPFGQVNEAELIKRILSVEPPRLDELRPEVPAEVAEWVASALAKAPAQRPQGLEGLRDALAKHVGSEDARHAAVRAWVEPQRSQLGVPSLEVPSEAPSAQTVEEPASPAPPGGRRRAWLGLAPVVLLAAGALAWWGWPVAPPPAPVVVPARVEAPPPAVAAAEVDAGVAEPPEEPVAQARPAVEHPAPPTGRTGSLWIRVRPWAQVFLDGKDLGQTPLAPIKLAPGKHTVLLVNEKLRVRKSYPVRVFAGRQAELKVAFDEGP
ncbi:MAG: protein kinase [Myxococcaceae bacterium]|nr:protein kinase [Myxococcaceae bacterium]